MMCHIMYLNQIYTAHQRTQPTMHGETSHNGDAAGGGGAAGDGDTTIVVRRCIWPSTNRIVFWKRTTLHLDLVQSLQVL